MVLNSIIKLRSRYIHRAALILVISFYGGVVVSCGGSGALENVTDEGVSMEEVAEADMQLPQNYKMPDRMDSLRSRLPQCLVQIFNDSNKYQYAHAEHVGIKPINSVADIYYARKGVIRVSDTEHYKLDKLTHSVPFLVPEAHQLLNDIGRAFADTLKRRHLTPARLKLTSLLRTVASVKKLRRVNRNATDSSTHQFATTFDISYSGFWVKNNPEPVQDERYKIALAEVLYDLRAHNRCMVKYERKSPCFHITVIK